MLTRAIAATSMSAKIYMPAKRFNLLRNTLVITAPMIAVKGKIPIRIAWAMNLSKDML